MAEATDFYAPYAAFRGYHTPTLKPKDVRRYDREFWEATQCRAEMSILEIGCGTGLFLAYLAQKGVADFLGIDRDPALASFVPAALAGHFRAVDIGAFLAAGAEGRRFHRAAMFDVIEHFAPEDGVELLKRLAGVLAPGARVLVRTPNAGSPWGLQYQFGDLTHKAAYNPSSIRQLALAAGYRCVGCLEQRDGSPIRQVLDPLLHRALSKILMAPPEVWSANFLAVLEPAP